eukprot:2794282-Amphidinium_carterae.1
MARCVTNNDFIASVVRQKPISNVRGWHGTREWLGDAMKPMIAVAKLGAKRYKWAYHKRTNNLIHTTPCMLTRKFEPDRGTNKTHHQSPYTRKNKSELLYPKNKEL